MKKEEIIGKFGNVPLLFNRYYKYSFTFCGIDKETGTEIIATTGGFHDDIYKLEVTATNPHTINSLDPEFIVLKRNGEKVGEFSQERW